MRYLTLAALMLTVLSGAEEKKEITFPIAEMKLTNGRVWKNVTVIRYEKESVVVKSSAGVGPIPYNYVSEPLRGFLLTEREASLAKREASQRATQTAENKLRNETAVNEQADEQAKAQREKTVREAIFDGRVIAGMTQAEAYKVLGAPLRKNDGAVEQWVYNHSYVYFRDDSLLSVRRR